GKADRGTPKEDQEARHGPSSPDSALHCLSSWPSFGPPWSAFRFARQGLPGRTLDSASRLLSLWHAAHVFVHASSSFAADRLISSPMRIIIARHAKAEEEAERDEDRRLTS